MDQREKERITAERERMKAKVGQAASIIDPMVRVKFQNIEDPPSPGRPSPPFEFCFQTAKGFILSFRISRAEEVPDTALRHGEIYELPLSVVNHLNNVQTPVYGQRPIKDPQTGAVKIINYISGYRNRFACTPVEMGAFVQVDGGKEGDKRTEIRSKKRSDQEKTNKELADLGSI